MGSGAVRAKFYVSEKGQRGYPGNTQAGGYVKLSAVSSGEGNASWSKYTPSGSVELQITNPSALDAFEVGKCYFLTFEAAE